MFPSARGEEWGTQDKRASPHVIAVQDSEEALTLALHAGLERTVMRVIISHGSRMPLVYNSA